MKTYVVTATAGPFVAGRTNPGAGIEMLLSAEQAAHELRLGSLSEKPSDAPPAPPMAEATRALPKR